MTKIQINRIKQQGMNFGESHQQGHYIAYPIGNSMIRKKKYIIKKKNIKYSKKKNVFFFFWN